MATNTVNVRLVHRHDTKANWAAKNPVLLQGEIGIEDDAGLFKIGDGVKAWDALRYANDAKTASHYEVNANVGTLEDNEERFKAAVMRILSGNYRVLASVKAKNTDFLRAVRSHPDCELYIITPENRNELYMQLRRQYDI